MATCPNCGQELADSAKFCGGCGTRIEAAAPQAPKTEVPQEVPAEETHPEFFFDEETETPAAQPEKPARKPFNAAEAGKKFWENSEFEEDEEDSVFRIPVKKPALPKGWGKKTPGAKKTPAGEPFGEKMKKMLDSALSALKKLPKKALIFGGAGMAGVLVLILVLALVLGGGSADDYSLYLKDGEMYYSDFGADPMELTSHLQAEVDQYGLYGGNTGYKVSSLLSLTRDNTRLFYPERMDYGENSFTLYYRELDKPKKDPVKIDSDVRKYAVNDEGDFLIYTKDSDNTLCWSDLSEDGKIEENVQTFCVADDLSRVVYIDKDNDLYLWTRDGDSERVAKDVENLKYIDSERTVVYFLQDQDLYKQSLEGGHKEKLVSDVYNLYPIGEDGTFYYTVEEITENVYMDFVEDDLAISDAAIEKPATPEYPKKPIKPRYYSFGSDEEYQAAMEQYEKDYASYEQEYDRLREEYEAAQMAYEQRNAREYMREALNTKTITTSWYHLYYFDGATATLVTENLANNQGISASSTAMAASLYQRDGLPKLKVSEMEGSSDVYDLYQEKMFGKTARYLITGVNMTELEEDATQFRFWDGEIYFLANINSRDEGDLYKVTVKDDAAGEPEEIDDDVCRRAPMYLRDNKLVYFKDWDTEKYEGTLFWGGLEIDSDVSNQSLLLMDGKLYYFADWNSSKQYGTLKSAEGKEGKEPQELAEDVHEFLVKEGGAVVYLSDYSTRRSNGSLYLLEGRKPELLDEDVSALLTVYSSRIKG